MIDPLTAHFRFPEGLVATSTAGDLGGRAGFFNFESGAVAFGRAADGIGVPEPSSELPVLRAEPDRGERTVALPFDLTEVVDNLRLERYTTARSVGSAANGTQTLVRRLYYMARPLLPVAVRRRLQRAALRGWERIAFPRWPVDFAVEDLFDTVLRLRLERAPNERLPFIWFWPEGRRACLILTHDVEAKEGRDFCGRLMDLDESQGFKSSFQVIPEERYEVGETFLDSIRERGFEVNVHGLNHDGRLFADREEFDRRAGWINRYVEQFGAEGFRAPVLYRNLEWYDAFDFAYDMTVPNAAHLEPQRGGCATALPYFIGRIVELPLTTIQDYSLFNILGQYSIDLWRSQADSIEARNGLISFNIHPDYVIDEKPRAVYRRLLQFLARMRDERNVWAALPGEVNAWWRSRSQMSLRRRGERWAIEGEGSERARIAFASLHEGRVRYELEAPAPSLAKAV